MWPYMALIIFAQQSIPFNSSNPGALVSETCRSVVLCVDVNALTSFPPPIDLLVNDRITHLAATLGVVLGGVLAALAGFNLAPEFVKLRIDNETSHSVGFYIVFVVGYVMAYYTGFTVVSTAFQPLNSGVATFFICWAEDSDAIAQSRPKIFNRIMEASNGQLKGIGKVAAIV